jgi:cell wall-associated NlpC family hydrolase
MSISGVSSSFSGIAGIESRIQAIEARINSMNGTQQSNAMAATRQLGSSGKVTASGFQDVLTGYTDSTFDVQGALSWARGEIGTAYACVNPYRFGNVPWDGGVHESAREPGKMYQFPAGTKVYDCSGFATAVWRQAGIDLAKYNATSSSQMWKNIPRVSLDSLQPGDLLIMDHELDGATDHVQVYQGNGRVIESTPSGVKERELSFKDVIGAVRPSLLVGATQGAPTSAGSNVANVQSQTAQATALLGTISQNQMSTLGILGGYSSQL